MKKTSLILISIMILIILGIFVYNTDKTKENVSIENPRVPTYEQGLWDGANGMLKYLYEHNYLTKDSVKIEITELDSVLHSK